jgi:DNA-binding protein H-NS
MTLFNSENDKIVTKKNLELIEELLQNQDKCKRDAIIEIIQAEEEKSELKKPRGITDEIKEIINKYYTCEG